MKKTFTMIAVVLLTALSVQAQRMDADNLGLFNHVGLSVGVGTTGITADLSLPITPYVAVRGGADIFPFKFNTSLKVEYRNKAAERVFPVSVDVASKVTMNSGHLLFDFFPSKYSSFHLTAGAYLGGETVGEVYNREDGFLSAVSAFNRIAPDDQKVGYALGDYFLTPDEKGNVKGSITASKFRPYAGIGFGRPVPTKSRVACNFDLGVQFWGSPKVKCQGEELKEENLKGDDSGVVKAIAKMPVWPVLNFRVAVRLF